MRQIYPSARRHGVADDDIHHAIDHRLVTVLIDEDPDRYLDLGPNRAGNFLELVTIVEADGSEVVIHSMPVRIQFLDLLPTPEEHDDGVT